MYLANAEYTGREARATKQILRITHNPQLTTHNSSGIWHLIQWHKNGECLHNAASWWFLEMIPKTAQELAAQIALFEGQTNYLYKDTSGAITLGVGLLFANAQALLDSGIPFYRKDGSPVVETALIRAEFAFMARLPKGRRATYYGKQAQLFADERALSAHLYKRLNLAWQDARTFYQMRAKMAAAAPFVKFDDLPTPAQCALADMAFNLGLTRLLAYTKLRQALRVGNFTLAAQQSTRKGVPAWRNRAIKQWFLAAGKTGV
jgi:GH24 family phage-related lysozyme (muramidase)